MTFTVLLGALLFTTVIFFFVHGLDTLFSLGLIDFIQNGFDQLSVLFGSNFMSVLVFLFIGGFLIMLARLILSFIGSDGGRRANT